MKYLLLIYDNEAAMADVSPDASQAMMAEYFAYSQELEARGVFLAGEGLNETKTATTVRVRNGKSIKSDGPFAETKEQLGGFYLIEVKDLDEALAWAAKVPSAKKGSIEVRPVMSY